MFFLILISIFSISCNSDDTLDSTILTAEDLIISVNENPQTSQTLGIIDVTSNSQTLIFAFISQSSPGALILNVNSGEISVGNSNLFDFENVQEISAEIKITDGTKITYSQVFIEIIDVFYENDLDLQGINSNGNCGFSSTDPGVNLTFNNGILFSTSQSGGHSAWYMELENDGNKITRYYYLDLAYGKGPSYTYNLNYDSNNQITSIEYILDDDGIIYTENFNIEYQADKIILTNISTNVPTTIYFNSEGLISKYERENKFLEFEYDVNNNLVLKRNQSNQVRMFHYDSKRNPFPDIAPLNWIEVSKLIDSHSFEQNRYLVSNLEGIWFNKNNITEVYANSSGNPVGTYSYTYNSDGYPDTKTISCDGTTNEYIY